MKRLMSTIGALVVAPLLLTACSQHPQYTTQTLPSGRVVKVAGVIEIHFSKDDPALMLKYYTDIDISDQGALQAEAEDIWQSFKVDVEKSGLKAAILSANEMPHGFISTAKGFNFVFHKQGNRDWVLMKDQKTAGKP